MAENILPIRIQLRYGTYAQWMNSNVILKLGEAAVAAFPNSRTIESSNSIPENTPPAIGIKIGDGQHYFSELPWVQGIAADVYAWAKQVTKPAYTASEIEGLDTYIEEHAGGGGGSGGTTVTRQYQITQGTGSNANRYYLRYRDSNDSSWITDTNHYIDLHTFVEIADWIGEDVNNFSSLGNRTEDHIQYDLSLINVNDSEQSNYVVTAVSQSGARISTVKRQLGFSYINGTVSVPKGGTGVTTFEPGEVLIGNGDNPILTKPIATEVGANTDLVYNYAVKAYVDQATAGLTGAMHFIGEATVAITGAVDPRINDYNFSQAQEGDVILWDAKEYVWTGSTWRLLGDEGSYAVKGSITDVDIAQEANIQQSKIANLSETFDTKVDKVEGKALSSNDYSDEDKQKLDGIEAGAQRNTIEHIFLNDTEVYPTVESGLANSVKLEVDEFDEDSRAKLAAIENEAQVNKIEHIVVDGQEIVPSNKTVTITSDPHTEHINVIEGISINGIDQYPDANKKVNITLDQAALNLDVIAGARVPITANTYEDVNVTIVNGVKKLDLARVAKTGLISDTQQTQNTYFTIYCGTSTDVV